MSALLCEHGQAAAASHLAERAAEIEAKADSAESEMFAAGNARAQPNANSGAATIHERCKRDLQIAQQLAVQVEVLRATLNHADNSTCQQTLELKAKQHQSAAERNSAVARNLLGEAHSARLQVRQCNASRVLGVLCAVMQVLLASSATNIKTALLNLV